MARSYATLDCGIWDDEAGFCGLSAGAQRTYFMLVSQRDIAACGVLALTLRRWGRTCSEKDVEAWLVELIDNHYVLIDEDTEELLVRTFVKWDGGYKHPQRLKAIHSSAGAIRSQTLRTAMATEMQKLGLKPASVVPQQCDSSPTTEASEPDRFRSEYVTTDLIPESTIQEREPSPSESDVEPSEFCSSHTNGTDKPCSRCATARQRHARWVKREARRKADLVKARSQAVIDELAAARHAAVPPPSDLAIGGVA